MVMTDKKAISIFVVVVAVIALLITLFSWAKPMTMGDKDDVNDIETILSAKENADVDVISIGDLGSYKDTDYQFVKYTVLLLV